MRVSVAIRIVGCWIFLTLAHVPAAWAASNYVAEVAQPFLSIARDEHEFGALVGALSPIGAWSAQAEIDSDLGGARATTEGCEYPAGFQQVCNTIIARGYGADMIRLVPTPSFPAGTPIEIVFYWFFSGSVDGLGAWGASGAVSLFGINQFVPIGEASVGYSTGGVPVVADRATYLEARTFTTTLIVGFTYSMYTRIEASSSVRTCPFGSDSCNIPLGIDVDFSSGAMFGARPRNGGYSGLQLVGDSGRDYLVPLPEPEMAGVGWLVAGLALRAIAAAKRQRGSGMDVRRELRG